MNRQDKLDFIMCKIVDYKTDTLDYDGIRDVIEDALNVIDKETAISFRDWCAEKQQPYVGNGFQDLDTAELWHEYSGAINKALGN